MAGIAAVVEKSGVDRKTVEKVFAAVSELILEGNRLLVPNFGIFSIKELRECRITSRILPNGEIIVPSRKTIRFRPSTSLLSKLRTSSVRAFQRRTW